MNNVAFGGYEAEALPKQEMKKWERINRVVSRYESVGQIARMLAGLTVDQRAAVLSDVEQALAALDAD